METFTRSQGYVSLDRSEIAKAIKLWLSEQDPPVYGDRISSIDQSGAVVLIWTNKQEGLIDQPQEEPAETIYPMSGWSDTERLKALKARLKNFARTARLDTLSCAIIQRQLLDIANEEEHDNGKTKD